MHKRNGLPRATCPDGHLSRRESRGFTLIELLFVALIIAILAVVAIVAYNNARVNSRDSRRMSDLANVVSALRMYQVQTRSYPAETTKIQFSSTTPGGLSVLVSGYIQTLPTDPTNSGSYQYQYYSDGTVQAIVNATMEHSTSSGIAGAYRTTTGGISCNGDTDYCLRIAP